MSERGPHTRRTDHSDPTLHHSSTTCGVGDEECDEGMSVGDEEDNESDECDDEKMMKR